MGPINPMALMGPPPNLVDAHVDLQTDFSLHSPARLLGLGSELDLQGLVLLLQGLLGGPEANPNKSASPAIHQAETKNSP